MVHAFQELPSQENKAGMLGTLCSSFRTHIPSIFLCPSDQQSQKSTLLQRGAGVGPIS